MVSVVGLRFLAVAEARFGLLGVIFCLLIRLFLFDVGGGVFALGHCLRRDRGGFNGYSWTSNACHRFRMWYLQDVSTNFIYVSCCIEDVKPGFRFVQSEFCLWTWNRSRDFPTLWERIATSIHLRMVRYFTATTGHFIAFLTSRSISVASETMWNLVVTARKESW